MTTIALGIAAVWLAISVPAAFAIGYAIRKARILAEQAIEARIAAQAARLTAETEAYLARVSL